MGSEDLFVHNGAQWHAVEHLVEGFPQLRTRLQAKLVLALTQKCEHLLNWPHFVITPKNVDLKLKMVNEMNDYGIKKEFTYLVWHEALHA